LKTDIAESNILNQRRTSIHSRSLWMQQLVRLKKYNFKYNTVMCDGMGWRQTDSNDRLILISK
jgi:hypothetical protein